MTERLLICYHGTKVKNVESILEKGFHAGTYFAKHLEDALTFGGTHVFEVAVPSKWWRPDAWQVTAPAIPPSSIVRHFIFESTTQYENVDLRRRVFESNP